VLICEVLISRCMLMYVCAHNSNLKAPRLILGDKQIAQVACGRYHSVALTSMHTCISAHSFVPHLSHTRTHTYIYIYVYSIRCSVLVGLRGVWTIRTQ